MPWRSSDPDEQVAEDAKSGIDSLFDAIKALRDERDEATTKATELQDRIDELVTELEEVRAELKTERGDVL